MNTPDSIHDSVMQRIRSGAVPMRPRWQFVLFGLLWGVGALLVLLVTLYLASLAVFMLRANGVWLAPLLGARGWYDIFRAAPLYIIVLVAIFALLLNIVVRHFAFAYRRPLVLSLGVVLLVTFAGGVLVGVTPFHRELHRQVRGGPLGFPYEGAMPSPPDDVFRGVVVSREGGIILIRDPQGATSTILITRDTHLPFGEDFSPGDMIVVIGDKATDTVSAYGIMEAEPDVDDAR